MTTANTDIQYDCKHVFYTESSRSRSDLLLIKEHEVHPDGTRKPTLRRIKDYKRPFYIVREGFRNFNDKKDYIPKKMVQEFKSTHCDLVNAISRALYGRNSTNGNLRQMCRSPYVYGCDLEPPVYIKNRYRMRYPDAQSVSTVSVFDIETNVVDGSGDILMATLSFKERIFTFVVRSFLGRMPDEVMLEKLREVEQKYLREHLDPRNATVEYLLVDTPLEGIQALFAKAHEWKPDFITGWNLFDFDIPKVLDLIQRAGLHPEDIFCAPEVPEEYRSMVFNKGKTHKFKEDGTKTPLKNYEKWPYILAPASFQWADSMCIYHGLRIAKGKELKYTLDYIAEKNIKIGKMKFEEADGFVSSSLEWHDYMQANYPFEYVAYNIFDCVVVELLDEKIMDLCMTVPFFCKDSQYKDFNSQPRRISEAMEFEAQDRGFVWGTTSDKMKHELDEHLPSLSKWIAILHTEMVALNGRPMYSEFPNLCSNIHEETNDIDVEGAYPTGTLAMNVGKTTTWIETCEIDGLDFWQFREVAVNLAASHISNASEIVQMVHKAPGFDTLLSDFMTESESVEQAA